MPFGFAFKSLCTHNPMLAKGGTPQATGDPILFRVAAQHGGTSEPLVAFEPYNGLR